MICLRWAGRKISDTHQVRTDPASALCGRRCNDQYFHWKMGCPGFLILGFNSMSKASYLISVFLACATALTASTSSMANDLARCYPSEYSYKFAPSYELSSVEIIVNIARESCYALGSISDFQIRLDDRLLDVPVERLTNWGVHDLNLEFVHDNGNATIWISGSRTRDFEWVVYTFDAEILVERLAPPGVLSD